MKESRKTRYTQTALRDSLLELMREKPFSRITITELCQLADINRTTFYAHYCDLDDMLRQVENETIVWLEEIVVQLKDKVGSNEMREVLEGVFTRIAQKKEYFGTLLSEKSDVGFQKRIIYAIYEKSETALVLSGAPAQKRRSLAAVFIVNGTMGILQQWLQSGCSYSPKELAQLIWEFSKQY
ncbi:MAG: TetR family transcriptional regulator C-terminal domain-containing protein [Oscillospiraceae bacterium]|jgi:AcrR family transcriptional regulator|nr:TetR family transcriptional regulator C-terminal domain-containing protein [Oscillospiraceae bacterium]